MSEDNGTYILVLRDGYRISQFHAVENLLNNIGYVVSAYDEKLTWDTEKKALNYALTLELENQTEYGVLYIEDYKNLTWRELHECASQDSRLSPKVTVLGALERSKNLPSVIMSLRNNN